MLHNQVVDKTPQQRLLELKTTSKFLDFLHQLDCISWDTWLERMTKIEEETFDILVNTNLFVRGKI